MSRLPTRNECLEKALELCDDYDYIEWIKAQQVVKDGDPNNMFWFNTDQLIEFINYCKGIDKNQPNLFNEEE